MGVEVNELATSMQQWQSLSSQAESGQLEIPEGVAFKCDEVCAAYIRHLAEMVAKTKNLVDVKDLEPWIRPGSSAKSSRGLLTVEIARCVSC